jgi:hypothetical protein
MNLLSAFRARVILQLERRAYRSMGAEPLCDPAGRYVLSMTSIRPRLATLHLVLLRTLRGSPKPRAVEIWLDEALRSELTPELAALERRGCSLNWVRDVGPHTKLVYALAKQGEEPVITIDDDIWLPRASLAALLDAHARYPRAVICNRARPIALEPDGRPAPYGTWRIRPGRSAKPALALLPLGYSGVLYPSSALDPRATDEALFRRLCPTGDDLWFTAMRLLLGGGAFNTGHLRGPELMVPGSGRFSIKQRHGVRGNNDESIARLFAELNLAPRLNSVDHAVA